MVKTNVNKLSNNIKTLKVKSKIDKNKNKIIKQLINKTKNNEFKKELMKLL